MEYDCLVCELQGEWVGNSDEEILIVYQDRIVENQPWLIKYLEPFRIQKDEIIIDSIRFRKNGDTKKYNFDIRYKIEYLSNDTLSLIKYGTADTTDRQELRFERLNPQYQYEFKKLSISSSPCYGSCPVFQIEIDSTGIIKFQGGIFNNRKGNYTGKIENENLELIQSQVDKVNWEQLKDNYWTEVTDTQYFNIEMENKNGKKYFLTTNSPESKAINILIFRTFKIIEKSELITTDKQLEFSTDLKYDRKK
jgi:hypothetical protein